MTHPHLPTQPGVVPRQRPRSGPHEAIPGRAPLLHKSYVPRRRLGEALDAAAEDDGITVLVAPAGAGKTLGVAGWLRDRGRQEEAVWVPKADTITADDLVRL